MQLSHGVVLSLSLSALPAGQFTHLLDELVAIYSQCLPGLQAWQSVTA
eukprot:COSAG01_NODE_68220_length_264_cov_2.496970_1_plen_47_part_01